MGSYYNECDPLKAKILREAIKANAIAPGDVDERSIVDVRATDLVGYTQCHFFAGGGFWSLALRQAGWPDDRPVWTGSCPCPSFSAAGKGQGFDDPRHLWPAWARLIRECCPPTIFGEQVSAAIGHGWLDLVQTDLEAQDYAVGKIVFGACSVGAPHIRQRLYFVAQSKLWRLQQLAHTSREGTSLLNAQIKQSECLQSACGYSTSPSSMADTADARRQAQGQHESGQSLLSARSEQCGDSGIVVDAEGRGLGMRGGASGNGGHTAQPSEPSGLADTEYGRLQAGRLDKKGAQRSGGCGSSTTVDQPTAQIVCNFSKLADTNGGKPGDRELQRSGEQRQQSQDSGTSSMAKSLHAERWPFNVAGKDGRDGDDAGRQKAHNNFGTCSEVCGAGPVNGFWRDADWIGCRDGKFRPVKSGTFPLASGYSGRVGLLRLAGDAINVKAAQAFIEAYLETEHIEENQG